MRFVAHKSRLAEVIVVFFLFRISYIEMSHNNITLPAVTIESRFLIPGPACGLVGCCIDLNHAKDYPSRPRGAVGRTRLHYIQARLRLSGKRLRGV